MTRSQLETILPHNAGNHMLSFQISKVHTQADTRPSLFRHGFGNNTNSTRNNLRLSALLPPQIMKSTMGYLESGEDEG